MKLKYDFSIKQNKRRKNQVSCVRCHESGDSCHVSRVTCQVSPVACHMSLTPQPRTVLHFMPGWHFERMFTWPFHQSFVLVWTPILAWFQELFGGVCIGDLWKTPTHWRHWLPLHVPTIALNKKLNKKCGSDSEHLPGFKALCGDNSQHNAGTIWSAYLFLRLHLIGDNFKWWWQNPNIGDQHGCLGGKYKPFGK